MHEINLLELNFLSLKRYFFDIDSKIYIYIFHLIYTIKKSGISPFDRKFLSVIFFISKKESSEKIKFEMVVFLY